MQYSCVLQIITQAIEPRTSRINTQAIFNSRARSAELVRFSLSMCAVLGTKGNRGHYGHFIENLIKDCVGICLVKH